MEVDSKTVNSKSIVLNTSTCSNRQFSYKALILAETSLFIKLMMVTVTYLIEQAKRGSCRPWADGGRLAGLCNVRR